MLHGFGGRGPFEGKQRPSGGAFPPGPPLNLGAAPGLGGGLSRYAWSLDPQNKGGGPPGPKPAGGTGWGRQNPGLGGGATPFFGPLNPRNPEGLRQSVSRRLLNLPGPPSRQRQSSLAPGPGFSPFFFNEVKSLTRGIPRAQKSAKTPFSPFIGGGKRGNPLFRGLADQVPHRRRRSPPVGGVGKGGDRLLSVFTTKSST